MDRASADRPEEKLSYIAPGKPSGHRDVFWVGLAAVAVSVTSLLYFYHGGMTNLYGDGIAHVNIARKVVDNPDPSLWRRYIQIGSPWLPLQTVLMLPLVWNNFLWRSGLAGSIVSMASFVVCAMAIHRLGMRLFSGISESPRMLAAAAASTFISNPSVVYMQSTPMTELPFLAALAVAVVALIGWGANQGRGRLAIAGLAMTAAVLCRYEAWPAAALSVAMVFWVSSSGVKGKLSALRIYGGVVLCGPLYWLWHNWAIFGNGLEFLTGPSSARGIYQQNRSNLGWSQIFVGKLSLDAILMMTAVGVAVGFLLVGAASAGLVKLLVRWRSLTKPLIFLLLVTTPFFFHVLSLYRGEIQVFPLAAFGLLNVRYGLPGILGISLLAPALAISSGPKARRNGRVAIVVLAAATAIQYGAMISDGPSGLAVFQEAFRNGVNARPAREIARAAEFLNQHPARTKVLMNSGMLGPLAPRTGLAFRNIIHEGTESWYSFTDHLPDDVATVITEDGDGLSTRLNSRQSLKADLSREFTQVYQGGRIRIYSRNTAVPLGVGR